MACFLSICKSEIFYWCPSSLWSTFNTDGFFWGGRNVWTHVKTPLWSSSVWGLSLCCLHPLLLNHISDVRAGLCAAYTAGREKIRIRVSFGPHYSQRACRAIVQRQDDLQRDEGRRGSSTALNLEAPWWTSRLSKPSASTQRRKKNLMKWTLAEMSDTREYLPKITIKDENL